MRSQELAPGGARPAGCRPHASAVKDPAHGAHSDMDPELAQLALDPDAAPPLVLPAQTDNEIGGFRIEWRPSRTTARVGPLPPDELAVPAKERLRRDHERGPSVPRERPARRPQERAVSVPELRPADGAAEHPHLVPEHGVLELELMEPPASAEESDQPNEQEVDERPQDGDATYLPRSEGPSFGAPQARARLDRHMLVELFLLPYFV